MNWVGHSWVIVLPFIYFTLLLHLGYRFIQLTFRSGMWNQLSWFLVYVIGLLIVSALLEFRWEHDDCWQGLSFKEAGGQSWVHYVDPLYLRRQWHFDMLLSPRLKISFCLPWWSTRWSIDFLERDIGVYVLQRWRLWCLAAQYLLFLTFPILATLFFTPALIRRLIFDLQYLHLLLLNPLLIRLNTVLLRRRLNPTPDGCSSILLAWRLIVDHNLNGLFGKVHAWIHLASHILLRLGHVHHHRFGYSWR